MMAPRIDWPALMEPVALTLLGEPNPRMSTAAELRYGRKGSLAVRLDSGQWFDHGAGAGGGVLDLVIHAGEAFDRPGAAKWIEDANLDVRRPESRSEALHRERPCRAAPSAHEAQEQARKASQRRRARQLWDSTRALSETVAAAYLDARGVGHVARAPALRFHPGITHPSVLGRFPALVAGVQDADGQFIGIHRTYLHGADKAQVDPPRLSLGSIGGGAVRLVEVVDDKVLLGEGIETTAAAVRALDWHGGAWATLSTSGMRGVVLPVEIRHVLIAADRDVEGAGQKAAAQLTERLRAEGRRVRIFVPETIGHDFCDELNGGG